MQLFVLTLGACRCVLSLRDGEAFDEMLGLYERLGVAVGVAFACEVDTIAEYEFAIDSVGGRTHAASLRDALLADLPRIVDFHRLRERWQPSQRRMLAPAAPLSPSLRDPDVVFVLYNQIVSRTVVARSPVVAARHPEFSVVSPLRRSDAAYRHFDNVEWPSKRAAMDRARAFSAFFAGV